MPTDLWYLDASAVVKLVMPEQGAETFRAWLDTIRAHQADGVVSDLVRIMQEKTFPRKRGGLLRHVRLEQHLGVKDAATIGPATLRSRDAVQSTAERFLAPALAGNVTDNRRLVEAAVALGNASVSL